MPRKLTTEDGKRYSLSARTTLALNQALKAAAEANGRSVSQEIEFRLEASFAEDRMRAIAREEIEKREAENGQRRSADLMRILEAQAQLGPSLNERTRALFAQVGINKAQ